MRSSTEVGTQERTIAVGVTPTCGVDGCENGTVVTIVSEGPIVVSFALCKEHFEEQVA